MQKGKSMKYNVSGIRRDMSFPSKDGTMIQGAKLYVTSEDSRVQGLMTDSFFISTTSSAFADIGSLTPGSNVDIIFNRYGKVDRILPLK